MNPDLDENLDRLLDRWADQRSVAGNELNELRKNVSARLTHSEQTENGAGSKSLRPTYRWRTVAAACLAVAAVLLVAAGAWLYQAWQTSSKHRLPQVAFSGEPTATDLAWPDYLRRQVRLLAEFQEVFGHQVAWVVDSDGQSDVGLLARNAPEVPVTEQFVSIRLTLVARSEHEAKWRLVQTYDVVARREELVEIGPSTEDEAQLVIWAYPIDSEMICVDLRFHPEAASDLQIERSEVQRMGQTANMQSFQQDGIEYRLYQTADLLDETVG